MTPTVAIIGAGAGGIAMGIELAAAGFDFTIFESADDFGGTWLKNTYPGAACDVPSHFYCYSFAPNPRWSRTYAAQPEILSYLNRVADEHGLRSHLVADTTISSLQWQDDAHRWTLVTGQGDRHDFDVVVTAVGMLDVPNLPDIDGAHRFGGQVFHSSRWDHETPTAGRRVASIGTGASAIQYVPEIAPRCQHLTVFQRSPTWVGPRAEEVFTDEQLDYLARHPQEVLKLRTKAFEDYELADFQVGSAITEHLTKVSRDYLTAQIADPELRAKLMPDYPVGCKRPLSSSRWFTTLQSPRVSLETSPIVEFTERGLRTANGVEHPLDVVIYGTGFRASDYLDTLAVSGRGGRSLRDDWADGPEAFLGTVIPGFPNLFTLYGPNTNGVTSIIYVLEAQAAFVRRILDEMRVRGATAVEVDRHAHDEFNAEIQRAMATSVWMTNCNNYFRHPRGKNVTQFPYSGSSFAERLAAVPTEVFSWSIPPR